MFHTTLTDPKIRNSVLNLIAGICIHNTIYIRFNVEILSFFYTIFISSILSLCKRLILKLYAPKIINWRRQGNGLF